MSILYKSEDIKKTEFTKFIIYIFTDEKEQACEEIQKKIEGQEIMLKAYKDLQLVEFAYKSGLNWITYDLAVSNLAEWIYSGKPYKPGSLTDKQLNDLFTSIPKAQGDPTSHIEMSTGKDGSIWGHDGTQDTEGSDNMVKIISENGKIIPNNYQIVESLYILKYGKIAGEKIFNAALAHEKTHSAQVQTEGFNDDSPGQQRRFEIAAYEAGIQTLKDALLELDCEKAQGSIIYSHNIRISYETFTQTHVVTGTVPFYIVQSSSGVKQNPIVKGSGFVDLSMNWHTEDCTGNGNSLNKVEIEGSVIFENEEKYLDLKFNEHWLQDMPITINCGEESMTINMPVIPPIAYENMKFKMKDGEVIIRPFSGILGNGTYSWTIRLNDTNK